MRGWLEDYIKSLLERTEDKESQIISLEELYRLRFTRRFCRTQK
jgi:hypothetical protein